MITIAIVGFSFTFLSSMFAGTAETTSQQIEQQLGAMSSCMQLDGVSFDKVYVRNCGSGSLYNFSVYVDGENIAVTNSPVITENAAGELALQKGVSGDAIKVSSPSAQVQLSLKHCNIDKLLPVGLVGYWMLDNDSALDYSGFGNNGVYYNGVNCSADGKFGKACKFDGVNDYISVENSATLNITGAITVGAWVKPNNVTPESEIVAKYGGYKGFILRISGGTAVIYITTPSVTPAATKSGIINDNWHHIVGVWDGSSTIKVYVNGVKGTDASATAMTNAEVTLMIGRWSHADGGYFNGTIDDVAIWNRSLSIDEIRKLYTSVC